MTCLQCCVRVPRSDESIGFELLVYTLLDAALQLNRYMSKIGEGALDLALDSS